MSVWAAIAQAAGSAAGSAASAYASEKAVKRQVEWEKERAKNAHQWEVEDLKKAGLNPILSAGGDGATTGGISAPIPDTTGISNAVASAYEALKTKTETAKTGAEINNINADTENKNINKGLLEAQTEVQKGLVGLNSAKETKEKLENIKRKVETDNAELEFWNKQINVAANTANQLSGTAGNIMSGILNGKKSKLKDIGEKYDFYQGKSDMPML